MDKNRYELAKELTKTKIQQAFVELLHEHRFEDITVRKIAERAQIGFKTFYRHYSEKMLVANAIAEYILQDLSQKVVAPTDLEAVRSNVRNFLYTVQDHMDAFRALTRTPIRDNLPQALHAFGISEGIRLLMEHNETGAFERTKRMDLVAAHFLNSQLQMVIWWVEHGEALPLEDIEQLIMDLVIEPIWRLEKTQE